MSSKREKRTNVLLRRSYITSSSSKQLFRLPPCLPLTCLCMPPDPPPTHHPNETMDGIRSFLSPDTSYMAEVGAWGVIQACLDEYHQRRSATNITAGTTTKQEDLLPRAVMLLPEAGPALLSAYESRAGTS